MNSSLLPLTRLFLVLTAIAQTSAGTVASFFQPLWNGAFMPPPLEPAAPTLLLKYLGAIVLGSGLGAVYAVVQNNWTAARTYLVIPTITYALAVVYSIPSITTPPGLPATILGYLGSAVVYVLVVVWIWRQESARREPA